MSSEQGQERSSPLLTGTLPGTLLRLEVVTYHALDQLQHPPLLRHLLGHTGVVDVPLALSLPVLALERVSFTEEREVKQS